jgi:Uma2 family endonuclease
MATRVPARRRATYEDLKTVPDHLIAQILDGELVVSPRPAIRHALSGSVLGTVITGPFQLGVGGPGGWWILDEPELHLAEDVVVPDLAGWKRARLPELPDAAFIRLAPDWVCEILSPSTERDDRARKLAIYRREGVSHVWLVNPGARTLEVLRLQGELFSVLAVHAQDAHVRAEPFDALELDLSLLWPPPSP